MKNFSHNTIIVGYTLLTWLIFSIIYFVLKKNQATSVFSAYLPLIGESGLDVTAAILTFYFWTIAEKAVSKIFLFFFASFIFALIADSLYNGALNLLHYQFENPFTVSFFFEIPFALFLFMQLCGWGGIFLLNHQTRNIILYTPHIILSLIILILFTCGIQWKIEHFSSIGIFHIIDTILEVISFALVTICLARSKTMFVHFVGSGFLLVVSSDIIIRYYVVSGIIPYLSSLEALWILGLIFICLGLFVSKKNNTNELFHLRPISSLQSQIAVWSLIVWFSVSAILLILSYTLLQKNENAFTQINTNILSMLIPMSVLLIITSIYLSTKISNPLSKLELAISKIISSENKSINYLDENNLITGNREFEIYEVEELKKFILDSLYEIRKANLVKSEFLMNMSHDFRTPASGIFHMSRTIYKKIQDPDLKKMQKLVIDSSEQLMNCLEDVLDYSRLESGQYKIDITDVNIAELINEVILFILPKIKEKNLDININVTDIQSSYKTNRIMLYRILLNIISNAIKFTHAGDIKIFAQEEIIDNYSWLLIRIKDTGIGIHESNHKIIFEPFTRLESHETSKYPGVGLGLSNVILMLNKLGGKIKVESDLGKGSVFCVLIPILLS